jgi:predicted transcriptional regulator
MGSREHRYRTKLEVLRDFLEAVNQNPHKTRIIGLANLNPGSYERYRELTRHLGLVAIGSEGCYLSTRGATALDALRRFSDKSSELDQAYVDLQRSVLGTRSPRPADAEPLDLASRAAWAEIVGTLARGPGRAILIDSLSTPILRDSAFRRLAPEGDVPERHRAPPLGTARGTAAPPSRGLSRPGARTPTVAPNDGEYDA